MIGLEQLLSYKIEEILESPDLRGAVISYCRKLYYGGALIRSCDSSTKNHFRHLQIDGIETQKRLENMKYPLKKDVVIVYCGQVYNSSTITDEIAEDYLAKFPKAIVNFDIKKEVEAKPVEVKEAAKPATKVAKPRNKKA